MFKASQVYNLCTYRPEFNKKQFEDDLQILKEKVEAKVGTFTLDKIKNYQEIYGLKKVSSTVAMHLEQRQKVLDEEDLNVPLPEGVQLAVQDIWLADRGFSSLSLGDESFSVLKGKMVEDQAIELINTKFKTNFKKNQIRMFNEEYFLSGEADLLRDKDVLDVKCPVDIRSFKSKSGIPLIYQWQLRAYMFLYTKSSASLIYVLMPTPLEILHKQYHNLSEAQKSIAIDMQQLILTKVPLETRFKIYNLDVTNIKEDMKFMKNRLLKSKKYYDSLTFAKILGV